MEDWSKYDKQFRYMMLSRLKMDCDYYFGNGGQSPDIVYYALKMGVQFDTRPDYVMYFRKNREDDDE